ncbi:Zn-ribbon domain-containing OB-fold protein [Rhodococcoides fascians]|uniref:Zn-ribbon domain-containing OB-fold protein n=1 Tax=Rhodococcoides fascians TaxID=1828 RepID=UPI00050C98B1|nr:OB-fold domain-containing protein [Rhodococcus fascians]
MQTHARPIVEGLFTWYQGKPRLIGSRRKSTGETNFPSQVQAESSDGDVVEILLSTTGTLFTWTTQQFRPPSPPYIGADDSENFQPYAVGYVELPEGILIEGRLTVMDPSELAIGQEMTLTVVPFLARGASGETDERSTFAFAPVPTQDSTEEKSR